MAVDRESEEYRRAYETGREWRRNGFEEIRARHLIVSRFHEGATDNEVAGLTNGYADAVDADSGENDIRTVAESRALQAAYEAAIDAGEIDSLDDGGIVRRAFRAAWIAGRQWQYGRASGQVMGRRAAVGDPSCRRVGERAVQRVSEGDISPYALGMAQGYQESVNGESSNAAHDQGRQVP